MAVEPSVTNRAETHEDELLEEVDNPIERLKLLSENDEDLSKFLDSIEVTSPREREMLREIARTRPLAQPEQFPPAHRNMAEALESLARHGYHGTVAGKGTGPLRGAIRWGVQLVARYLVVSHIRNTSTKLRNLYGLREIQAVPGTPERRELRRARWTPTGWRRRSRRSSSPCRRSSSAARRSRCSRRSDEPPGSSSERGWR